jgi:putative spermidine/putrescine transport system ATP-binding protein
VTMVYVTHDQSEALTMSDRIAVFHHGRIQQLDGPARIYEEPVNAFVARFIGENNRLDGIIESADRARCTIRLAGDTCIDGSLGEDLAPGAPVTISLRPERVQIPLAGHTMPGAATSRLEGTLREVIYLGDHVRLRVALPGNDEFMVKRPISETHALPAIGAVVELAWAPEHCRAFAREDGPRS